MADPHRILIIRPSALGDVCRSVPVLASLRHAYPDATIDWLVQDSFADAVRHHPMLDGLIEFPRKALGASSKRGNVVPTIRWMNRELRKRPRYDLVIDAQGLFRSGLFTRWTGTRRRVGYRNAAERASVFYTDAFHIDTDRHAVDRMLALLQSIGLRPVRDLRLFCDPAEQAKIQSEPWTSGRYAVLAPTSRWRGKQWPAERFLSLGRHLLARGVDSLAIVGGPGEEDQIRPLLEWAAEEPRAIDLVGKTSIACLMAIVEQASLVVANDSAALHMAVGFDRPLVGLFGPTRVDLVGPAGRGRDVIQHVHHGDRFEHKNEKIGATMMQRIGKEEVLAACLARLA